MMSCEPTAVASGANWDRRIATQATWRTDALERAGFGIKLAHELAARPEVDLHLAVDLVENGCSPELAARILL